MDKPYDDGPLRHSQLRRLAIFLAGTLIVVSLTSYAALAYELSKHTAASTGTLFNVINTFHTFSDTRPWTDEQEHLATDDDRFTLHPEDHVFRQPRKISLEWSVTKESRAPDGVSKDIYLINGLFPGPTIEARPGDELEIHVTNNVHDEDNDGIAVHWHGLYMKGANEMDGAVGVTQCTIQNNKSFLYKFKVDDNQHGTFWYHAHSAVKRADGLYGGLVIHKPAGQDKTTDMQTHKYDSEKLLMVSDWHHWNSTFTRNWYTDSDHFGREPPPESIIINGQGSFNCSMSTHYVPTECVDTEKPAISLPSGKSVRLRVINTGADTGYSLQLQRGGSLRLISVDGGSIVDRAPLSAAVGVLYPGERMDVVLEDTKGSKREEVQLTVVLDEELMQIVNPALDPIQSFPISWPTSETTDDKRDDEEIAKQFDLQDAQGESLEASSLVHAKPDNLAVLYASLSIRSINNNHPTGDVNHTAWVLADPNAKPMLALDRADWGNVTKQPSPIQQFKVPYFEDGGWMDLVINNMDDRGHPFHMHGYDFYVIESASNTLGQVYNPFDPKNTAYAQQKLNTKTPLRKDTVRLPPMGHIVLRFKLDNPGLWLMHCHVLWHQAVGMGIVVQVGNVTETTMAKAGEHCT